jgi:hypothetical protein
MEPISILAGVAFVIGTAFMVLVIWLLMRILKKLK